MWATSGPYAVGHSSFDLRMLSLVEPLAATGALVRDIRSQGALFDALPGK